MKHLILLWCVLSLCSCMTYSKNQKKENYQVNAKVWVDGKLVHTPSVVTTEDNFSKISVSDKKKQNNLKLLVNRNKKNTDLYKINIDFKHSKEDFIHTKENIELMAKFGKTVTVEKENTKYEFEVIKL